jgi:hypothetical protein
LEQSEATIHLLVLEFYLVPRFCFLFNLDFLASLFFASGSFTLGFMLSTLFAEPLPLTLMMQYVPLTGTFQLEHSLPLE